MESVGTAGAACSRSCSIAAWRFAHCEPSCGAHKHDAGAAQRQWPLAPCISRPLCPWCSLVCSVIHNGCCAGAVPEAGPGAAAPAQSAPAEQLPPLQAAQAGADVDRPSQAPPQEELPSLQQVAGQPQQQLGEDGSQPRTGGASEPDLPVSQVGQQPGRTCCSVQARRDALGKESDVHMI